MKFAHAAAAVLAAVPVLATPVKRQSTNIDATVLQFALTLEHLEDAFYSYGLRRLNRSSFFAAGYDQFYYDNLKRITDDEKSHVALLTSALQAAGQQPVAECSYNFEAMGAYKSVQAFVGLSSVLEGVGTSAYLGGAPLITSKAYLTVAASILVTESLHTSYQRNAVKEVPFATPYGTPLDPTSVYTLAAAFISSCPKSNVALPFTPYPSLTAAAAATAPSPGTVVSFTASSSVPAGAYLTFVSGLNVTSVAATGSGTTVSAAIPHYQAGQVYVLATKMAATANNITSAGQVYAGPAILEVAPQAPMFLS